MVTIEKVQSKDIPEVKQLLSFVWSCTCGDSLSSETIQKVTSVWHNPEGLKRQAETPSIYFAVAKNEEHKIVGLVTANTLENNSLYISRLYIHPDHQRQGIGSQLYTSALSYFPEIKRVRLDVEEQNKRALNFYKKQGFTEIGTKTESIEGEEIKMIKMDKII